MNTTGTVLFVRGGGADGGGTGALEGEFEVVVAEGAVDAVKRLSAGRTVPDCLVTPATIGDLSLDAFIERIRRESPETAVVIVGHLPDEAGEAAAVVEADAYLPSGLDAALPHRVRRLLAERRVDRAIAAHDRLGRSVRRVSVAAAGAPDRETIESAVYDELLEGHGYRHVWIARREDDELEVSVPVSGRLGEEELGDLVGGGDPSFAARAVESGQVVVTEGHVPSRGATDATPSATTYDGGEKETLASAAVPFVHDSRVHGVAIVSTERQGAFDGSERAVLSDLGAVVGHALWSVSSGPEASTPDPGRGMENLVHDLRNPLGVARSHLEIAREDGAEESLERVDVALDRTEATIDRVAAGVSGGSGADVDEVDVGAAAETAWDSIESGAATLEVDGVLPTRADRDLLVRLFSNLFQNSVDHGGESVTIRVGSTPTGFFVEDDGPGIPTAERDAVFDRGYSTSNDGLGIGLSIVEDAVEAHGWEISVGDSEAGGARFEVTGVDVSEDDQVEENETA